MPEGIGAAHAVEPSGAGDMRVRVVGNCVGGRRRVVRVQCAEQRSRRLNEAIGDTRYAIDAHASR